MTPRARRTVEPVVRTDEDLMARIKGGDEGAFSELYDRYGERAYRVSRSVCATDGRAEAAVSATFVAIWQRRAWFRPGEGTVASWLLAAVYDQAVDGARGQQEPIAETSPSRRHVGEGAGRAGAHRVQALLATLPDDHRQVIALALYGDLTHCEIARELGLPPETIKGRMRLGLGDITAGRPRSANSR